MEIGNIIDCIVTGIEDYGIFVKAPNDFTGLIHISEISNKYVKNILDYVSVGEEILCEVKGIDLENKKLKLSIKDINYKLIPKYGNIKDTKDGFKKLQMNLPVWIRNKIKEINEKNN